MTTMSLHKSLFYIAVTLIIVSTVISAPAETEREEELDEEEQIEKKARSRPRCGVRKILPPKNTVGQRIVGGKDAYPHSWPWVVNILANKTGRYVQHNCGGALLKKRWIVTAAHCVDNFTVNQLRMRVGDNNQSDVEPVRQSLPPSRIILHPNFTVGEQCDIALVELRKDVMLNKYIQTICVPKTRFKWGTMCTVIGWGRNSVSDPAERPNKLQEVELPLISHAECRRNYTGGPINGNVICAGGQAGKSSCRGDSGGPLMCQGASGAWELVGVVSSGVGCGTPMPRIFADVKKHMKWINSIIN